MCNYSGLAPDRDGDSVGILKQYGLWQMRQSDSVSDASIINHHRSQ